MERQIDQWAAQFHNKAQKYQELREHIAMVSSEATGADGAVRVRVNASGVLTELELDERIRNLRPMVIAEEIMTAIRRAQSVLGQMVVTLMKQTVGEDKRSIEVVAENYSKQFPSPEVASNNERVVPSDDPTGDFLRGLP